MNKSKSPIRYFKEGRARKLPVIKCYVSKDWETTKNANVIFIREHVTGHLTVGFYLVDLLCVGVKDSFFFFNKSPLEFDEKMGSRIYSDFKECSCELAHNIVWAGVEFAGEFGIEPVKEFGITKYILDEDNENVTLIDIATGDNGEPLLSLAPNDPRKKYYIDCLNNTVGKGNYHYIVGVDDEFEVI